MKITQQAFINKQKMLKGGLHCHTTRSDGRVEPGEVIRMHKANGYDFLAITDHRRYNYENFAPETDLLIIPGMEMDRGLNNEKGMCFHTVAIGPTKEDGNGYEQDQQFETGMVTDQAEYQKLLDDIAAHGNFSIYAHPDWSCTPYTSYDKMQHIFAMEIWNTGCAVENGMDTNAYGWDEILREGRTIYGVATDDGHQAAHHCKGWVCVAAEKTVASVLSALREGKFYSSCGPEIFDFYVEDNKVTIECSPVCAVRFIWGNSPTWMQTVDPAREEQMTSVTAPIRPGMQYVRAEIKDEQGRRAWTNPIFFDR